MRPVPGRALPKLGCPPFRELLALPTDVFPGTVAGDFEERGSKSQKGDYFTKRSQHLSFYE
jgi:hypothetical protein